MNLLLTEGMLRLREERGLPIEAHDAVVAPHATSGFSAGWWMIKGRQCDISLEPRPHYCDRGNYIAKLFPRAELALEIDGHDGWPRYYFDLDRAILEIEAWLEKRGQLP